MDRKTKELEGTQKLTWQPVRVRLGDLDGWEGNPKKLSKVQTQRLLDSTQRLGQVQTIAVSPVKGNGRRDIYDGHQRNSVWQKIYSPDLEVWALEASRPLTEEERRDVAMLTMTARGSFDWDILSAWDNLDDYFSSFDICSMREDISALEKALKIEKNNVKETDIKEDDALVAKWSVEVGDTWFLGEHTLYCGDARDAGIECDFAFFDPPYNWDSNRQREMLEWLKWNNALVMGLDDCLPLTERNDFCSWMLWDTVTGFGLSTATKYYPRRSYIMLLWFGDRKRFYKIDALRVLHRAGLYNNFVDDIPQCISLQKSMKFAEDIGHSNAKPDVLIDYLITLFSRDGEVIGDPFAGSGAVLLSAHRLGRKYRGSEIEPRHCALILERFYSSTGIMPYRNHNSTGFHTMTGGKVEGLS